MTKLLINNAAKYPDKHSGGDSKRSAGLTAPRQRKQKAPVSLHILTYRAQERGVSSRNAVNQFARGRDEGVG